MIWSPTQRAHRPQRGVAARLPPGGSGLVVGTGNDELGNLGGSLLHVFGQGVFKVGVGTLLADFGGQVLYGSIIGVLLRLTHMRELMDWIR